MVVRFRVVWLTDGAPLGIQFTSDAVTVGLIASLAR